MSPSAHVTPREKSSAANSPPLDATLATPASGRVDVTPRRDALTSLWSRAVPTSSRHVGGLDVGRRLQEEEEERAADHTHRVRGEERGEQIKLCEEEKDAGRSTGGRTASEASAVELQAVFSSTLSVTSPIQNQSETLWKRSCSVLYTEGNRPDAAQRTVIIILNDPHITATKQKGSSDSSVSLVGRAVNSGSVWTSLFITVRR
ncbi:hypothetical protein EYF80_055036 [Liparis tanakae]|uniref:Uncharacterized protein n=1 Tax=Liparis tanakae TaxID=230148 RepID=A0A4Z2F0Z2_9TELE|nr:hypothetical protein EYF80_055036 [Liparis tanakae]